MLVFIAQNLAPIMFVSLFVFLLLGYPVAFSLAAVGLAYFAIGVQLAPYAPDTINLDWALIGVMPDRIYGIMNNETLLAVPFFTLMGLILERSGMAEDLLDTIGQLFGSVKGGLAFAVIFVGALLAATTGVVAASVISMGLISLPIMLRYGYDRRMAAGVIAASGTLAQIIPPSLVLIVMADQLGRSVGDMYKGAFIPGFILTFLYAGYVVLVSLLKPEAAPALPPEARIIKEDPTKATRQALLTVIGLLAFGVVFYYFLIYAAIALAGAAGYSLADQPVERKWALAVILSIASFGWRLVGDAFRRTGAAPRLNTTATFGAMVALSYLMFLWFARVFPATPGENLAVWAGFAGIAILYVVALADQAIGTNVMGDLTQRVVIALVPPLALVFLVLGTIFVGIATPTEGGAMGATGALVLALARRRLSFDLLRQAVDTTAKLSCFVVFILIGARVFSLTFYGVNGHLWVEHLLTSLPGGQVGFLAVVNLIVFRPRLFPRFLRAGLHHHSAAGARRRQARHRSYLVRRDARGQSPDLVHASALRLRAVLSALRGADQTLSGQDQRQDDRAGDDRPDLSRRHSLRDHPGDHGGARHRLPSDGAGLQGGRSEARQAAIRAGAEEPCAPAIVQRRTAATEVLKRPKSQSVLAGPDPAMTAINAWSSRTKRKRRAGIQTCDKKGWIPGPGYALPG